MKKILIGIAVITLFVLRIAPLNADQSYSDSFDGNGNITWQVKDGTFTIENERYLAQSQDGADEYAIAITPLVVQEGTIQATFQSKSSNILWHCAFLVFGYQDNSNFYMIGARVGANKWTVERIQNGIKTELVKIPQNMYRDIDYTIKVALEDGKAILTVNDLQKLSYTFKTLPQGSIGLGVNNAVSYFDDVIISLPQTESTAIPRLMRFQGLLKDKDETPLDGTYTLTFSLYDKETEATPLWKEIHKDVNIKKGILDVELGSITPLNSFFDTQYYLGVEVESDGEMTPRFKLTTVPYAFTTVE